MKKCSECESEKIIKNANVWETDQDGGDKSLNVAIYRSPNALIFKEKTYSTVKADVCGDCGFLKMYATEPNILWEAYLHQQENLSEKYEIFERG